MTFKFSLFGSPKESEKEKKEEGAASVFLLMSALTLGVGYLAWEAGKVEGMAAKRHNREKTRRSGVA